MSTKTTWIDGRNIVVLTVTVPSKRPAKPGAFLEAGIEQVEAELRELKRRRKK